MKKRQISEEMLNAFLSGELFSLLEAVKKDDTLDLELRGNSVNIYYRGGSIFKIAEINNSFSISFDINYCIGSSTSLSGNPSPAEAVANLPFYKQAMDWWFHKHPKYEREFQQVIARENNNQGKISSGTDYYIADIEFADGNARFDMVALKWLSNGAVRRDTSRISLALIEVKYGNGALKGTAGIEKHLEDFRAFLSDREKVSDFCRDMSLVFSQKCRLGLVDGLNEKQYDVKISSLDPEVIFLFANHDPESKILPAVLKEVEPNKYPFPILVANASYMGYGLYAEQMKQIKGCTTTLLSRRFAILSSKTGGRFYGRRNTTGKRCALRGWKRFTVSLSYTEMCKRVKGNETLYSSRHAPDRRHCCRNLHGKHAHPH